MHKYKLGLYVGRFQPLHKGHEMVINKALSLCDRLIVVIGSAQASGTEKNPFSFEFRKKMIEKCFGDKVTIIGINDRQKVVNDSSWGTYLLNGVYSQLNELPDVTFQGEEAIRDKWFNDNPIAIELIDRSVIPISATQLREALINGNKAFWEEWCFTGGEEFYDSLREGLKGV